MLLTCPIEYFAGTVELEDCLGYPQLAAYERAMLSAQRIMSANQDVGIAELRVVILPGLLVCVKTWSLDHVPEKPTIETFPAIPRDEAGELFQWVAKSVKAHIDGEDPVPNV